MLARLVAVLLGAAVSLSLAGAASAQKILKLNESSGPGSPEDIALQAFKGMVEEQSKGQLTVEVHLLDALGGPDVSLESLMTGSLDLYSGALEYYASIVGPEINVISLPFFVGTHDKLRAYLKSDAFKPALDKLGASGIRVLSTEWNGDRGPYRVLMSSKEVRTVDDLQGLKVRMFPNEVYQRSWSALGTLPIQLAWTETYLGIRQGTVNSVTAPLSMVRAMKFAEVAPYIVEIKEYPQTWPKFDGGICTRLDCVPFSVVLNQEGDRFYDEGEDTWPKRYAIWGRLVAAQPGQVGFSIIDSKSIDLFMPSVFPPTRADSIGELAGKLGLDPGKVARRIAEFNAACPEGTFHPTEKDGLATAGITPAKTNWARPIDTPPFYGYALRPGVTFTYLGLQVDETARVEGPGGSLRNVWAAGEIMAGSILGEGYLAGFGMAIGTVFGRIAGREAAAHVA